MIIASYSEFSILQWNAFLINTICFNYGSIFRFKMWRNFKTVEKKTPKVFVMFAVGIKVMECLDTLSEGHDYYIMRCWDSHYGQIFVDTWISRAFWTSYSTFSPPVVLIASTTTKMSKCPHRSMSAKETSFVSQITHFCSLLLTTTEY